MSSIETKGIIYYDDKNCRDGNKACQFLSSGYCNKFDRNLSIDQLTLKAIRCEECIDITDMDEKSFLFKIEIAKNGFIFHDNRFSNKYLFNSFDQISNHLNSVVEALWKANIKNGEQ